MALEHQEDISTDHELVLVRKHSIDGQLIYIYANSDGRIKATITDKDGIVTSAFFVKGIDPQINVSDIALVQWLKDTLEQVCYLKVTGGDVHVNLQVKGGLPPDEQDRIALGCFSVLQGLCGLVITPVAPIVGGILIGSAMKSGMYLYNTPANNINFTDLAKAEFIGGVGGAFSGVVSSLAAPVGFLQDVGTGAVSGAVKSATEAVAKKAVYPLQSFDLTVSQVAQDAGTGAMFGGAKNVGLKFWNNFTSEETIKSTEKVVSRATKNLQRISTRVAHKRTPTEFFKMGLPVAKKVKLESTSVIRSENGKGY